MLPLEDEEIVEQLRKSMDQLEQIYSVIQDEDGEVLSGAHRLRAGATKIHVMDTRRIAMRLGVSRKMVKLMIKLHSNIQRTVPREETRKILEEMAEELVRHGVKPEDVATELVKHVPYSRQYVLELLPEKYKKKEKVEAGKVSGERRRPDLYSSVRFNRTKMEGSEPVKMEVVSVRPMGEIRKPQIPFKERMEIKAYTRPEIYLADLLSKGGIRFLTQYPVERPDMMEDGRPKVYMIDILVGDSLALEIDGEGHDPSKDEERDSFLREKGYSVLHIPAGAIERFPDFVLNVIKLIGGIDYGE